MQQKRPGAITARRRVWSGTVQSRVRFLAKYVWGFYDSTELKEESLAESTEICAVTQAIIPPKFRQDAGNMARAPKV
jgi:hypothetical protein